METWQFYTYYRDVAIINQYIVFCYVLLFYVGIIEYSFKYIYVSLKKLMTDSSVVELIQISRL